MTRQRTRREETKEADPFLLLPNCRVLAETQQAAEERKEKQKERRAQHDNERREKGDRLKEEDR